MFVAFIGFPAATGIALVADDIISMTYHGSSAETIPLMRILALSIPIVVIDMVLGMVMFASDRQKQWMILGVVTMFINPAINIFAIPYAVDRFDNGAIGAATATVVTELVVLGGALFLVPRGVMDRATTSFVLRCLAAAATMAVIVLALGDIPLAAKIAVGVLSYAAATLLSALADASRARSGSGRNSAPGQPHPRSRLHPRRPRFRPQPSWSDMPQSNSAARRRVSAVICTRNRPDMIRQAVTSVLANDHPDFDLTIIDQSTTDETRQAIADLIEGDPRLSYMHTTEAGLSRVQHRHHAYHGRRAGIHR